MKKVLTYIIIFLAILAIASPFLAWHAREDVKLNVAILDKTVPDESYREHAGLTWLLNNQKYVQRGTMSRYNVKEDYYGFFPMPNKEYITIDLPNDLEELDLIYVADTYGVFHEEFYGENIEGQRSEKIYGGLTIEEVETIRRYGYDWNTTVIAEFNSFASPTTKEVREKFTEMLSLQWTGWIGRYFHALDSDEVPVWAIRNYETQYGKEWEFSEGGFLLVDENDTVVVLEDKLHIGDGGIKTVFTETGQSLFSLKESPRYNYWFDIVVPYMEEDVLAYYDWDLTEEGKNVLEEFSIPTSFPAVVASNRLGFQTYYFAGDYVDIGEVPSFYQMRGLTSVYRWFSMDRDGSTAAFFWQTYIPMMKEILHTTSEKEQDLMVERAVFQDDSGMYTMRLGESQFQVYREGIWEDIVIKGVNMGIAKPGSFPGETTITEEEYYRWFQMIGEMNANTVRVYTLHPPGFYRALERYNLHYPDNPIYLFHGMWIGEEGLEETLDAFDEQNTEPFKREIANVIDAVHGNIVLPVTPGHASGEYTADVSPYVIGWILGIEWYPPMVLETNERYTGLEQYDGYHVYSDGAEPFEVWLAEMFDYTLEYELSGYGWKRPISFTNWVTTDLLEHPSEPSEEEDLVGVDPNVIYIKDHMGTGQFASYHVYPYYPDFLNYEPRYLEYVDHRGERNNYAAYLKDLHEVHQIPVLIAEFGVPNSRGLTHENPFGWNQGFLSESEQGEINARLFEDIVFEGMLGGLVFAWHDEWFKRTWNTMDLDSPYRRPFWSDAQTNEQNFGLLSFDRLKIPLRGRKDDWRVAPLYERGNEGRSVDEENIHLQSMYMDYDERFLYFRLDITGLPETDNLFSIMNAHLLLNIIPDQGNEKIQIGNEEVAVTFEGAGIDFLISLDGYDTSAVFVDSYYDPFYYQYGHVLGMIDELDYPSEKNNGFFHPIKLTLSKEMIIPTTGELVPFTAYDTGQLRHGIADPNSDSYDSLADFYVEEAKGMVELRIPWLLLNIKDPSLKEVMGDLWEDGLDSSIFIDGLQVAVLLMDKETGEVTDSFPPMEAGIVNGDKMAVFQWEVWETNPKYVERLKQSYYIMQELFSNY
ncbi:MAG: hypothetical protein LRY73_16640 [Bacillus sp. (in: Bacteria)]|nr:hypothetical protein [Bacillus sp. (in: firmicutes)]